MNKFNECCMIGMVMLVVVMGLGAITYMPIKCIVEGDIPGVIATSFVAMLIWLIVGSFAYLGLIKKGN